MQYSGKALVRGEDIPFKELVLAVSLASGGLFSLDYIEGGQD